MNWPVRLRRVSGVSLMPTVRPGRIIVFFYPWQPRVGQLVLAQAEGREVIKVITAKTTGGYHLGGILAGSAAFEVKKSAILGVAVGYNNAYESTRRPAS